MEEDDDLPEPDSDSDDDFLRAVANAPDARPPPSESTALTQLAQFRILERIGRGGMGIVYRAEDEKLKRVVALKVLPEDFDDDESRKRRFLREARVAASLAHANVAAVHEVGEADGRIFIAMELVEGRTLRSLLEGETRGRLGTPEALRIAREIARGLSLAHERGIAHRDLKPDNVMVGSDGVVKVLDFGLAKPVDVAPREREQETVSWTQEGRILGTPGYMSPEQATGRPVDVRTDVFSIGVMLYEMLTGKRPFAGDTSMEVLMATSRDVHVPVQKLAPRVPTALADVVDRCLAKSRDERYESASELLRALEGIDGSDARAASKIVRVIVATSAVAILAVGATRLLAAAPPQPAPGLQAEPATSSSVAMPLAPLVSPSASVTPPPPPATSMTTAGPAAVAAVRPVRGATPAARPAPSAAASAPPPVTPAASRGGVIETSPYWNRRSMRRLPWVLSLSLFLAPFDARADEAPPDDSALADARKEFVDGTALVRAQRWGEALAAFERAAKLKPHAITTYNIAQCERAMGQYTRARKGFGAALSEDAAAEGKQLPDSVKEEAKGLLRELEGILAKVRLTMRPEGATIAVDGRPLEREPTGELVAGTLAHGPGESAGSETFDLVLNPGMHVITVTRPGYQDVVLNKTFAPGTGAPLVLELDRLPASIRVTSNVADAIVRMNGTDVGNPPVEVSRTAGTYRVVVSRKSFVGYETDVTLSPGQRVELAADLRRENPPITQKWWFWAGAAVILAGAAATTYFVVRSNEEPQRQPTDGGGLGWSLRVP